MDEHVSSPELHASTPSIRSRTEVIGQGGKWLAQWSLRFILIAIAAWTIGWAIGELWVVFLPVALSVVVATVLWPPTRFLTNRGVPAAAAASLSLIGFIALLVGIIALIAPSFVEQSTELANKATEGVQKVQDWVQGPPLNLADEQISSAVDAITEKLQSSSESIAAGVFSGVSAAGSALVTFSLVLMLSFFFIKDGPRFLPWLEQVSGPEIGKHFHIVLSRIWDTLGGFICTQAIVSLIDAVFIGVGLLFLGVPLAPALAVLTFIGGFVPIVGAFVAGAVAVLIALVSNGVTTALFVLLLIIVVQQIEGNILQPILQSKSMNLHATIVLLAITAGSSLFGVVGAFLSVPVVAIAAVIIRYLSEVIEQRTTSTVL
ncbi:MAG: AI-2E family transporter [Mycobacteriaceae bacterium]